MSLRMKPATDGFGQLRQPQQKERLGDAQPQPETHDQPHSRDAENQTSRAQAQAEATDAVVPPRRYSTFLAQLATDEVRMIMQCLDAKSLCYLARCCRQMFADADSPVAWRFQPPLDVPLSGDEWSKEQRQQLFPPSLLAHVPKDAVLRDAAKELSNLVTIPRLVRLWIRLTVPLSPQDWQLLHKAACVETLKQLDLTWRDGFANPTVTDLLNAFSAVTDLAVKSDEQPFMPAGPTSTWNGAGCRLRRLKVYDNFSGADSQAPSKFTLCTLHCPSVTYLHVDSPTITGQSFVDFFTSPAMTGLQVLRLDGMSPPPPEVDYRPAFAALRQLRSFMVALPHWRPADSGDWYDRFFKAVAVAPALDYLGFTNWDGKTAPVPSPPVLAQLLVDSPKLHISLLHSPQASDAARAALEALNQPRLNVRDDSRRPLCDKQFFVDEAGFLQWPEAEDSTRWRMKPTTGGIGQLRQPQQKERLGDAQPQPETHDQPHSRDAENQTSRAQAQAEATDAVVPPRRYSTFLAQLATDEVRMIMQCLDAKSLCYLARCCRQMFADADSPVAWRFQPPLDVPTWAGELFEIQRQQMLPPSLLAHAPKEATLCNNVICQLAALVTVPRLVSLTMVHHGTFSPQQWQRLQEWTSIETIMQLDLKYRGELDHANPSVTALLQALPAVTELIVRSAEQPFLPVGPASSWNGAGCRLRRLHVYDSFVRGEAVEPSRFILSVLHCSSLTHLTIDEPSVAGAAFVDFFANPAMANLQVLRLESMRLQPPPEVDFRPAFAALRQLRSFMTQLSAGRLAVSNESWNRFFAAVAAAPTLEYLGIDDSANSCVPVPSPPVLSQLLGDSAKLWISVATSRWHPSRARATLSAMSCHPRLVIVRNSARRRRDLEPAEFMVDRAGRMQWPEGNKIDDIGRTNAHDVGSGSDSI